MKSKTKFRALAEDLDALCALETPDEATDDEIRSLVPAAARVAAELSPDLLGFVEEEYGVWLVEDIFLPLFGKLVALREFAAAEALIDRLIDNAGEDSVFVAREKAYLLAEAGKSDAALAWIARIRGEFADDVWTHITSARAYATLDKHADAADVYEHVFARSPHAFGETDDYDFLEQFDEYQVALEKSGLAMEAIEAKTRPILIAEYAPAGWAKGFRELVEAPRHRAAAILKRLDVVSDALTPVLLDILADAARHPTAYVESEALFQAIFTLGDWREPKALPLLFEILRLDRANLDDLFGDVMLELFSYAAADMAGENAEALVEFAAEGESDEFAASVALGAVEVLTADRRLAVERARELVRPLLHSVPRTRFIWQMAAGFLAALGAGADAPLLESAIGAGEIDERDLDVKTVRENMLLSEEDRLTRLRETLHWLGVPSRLAFAEWTEKVGGGDPAGEREDDEDEWMASDPSAMSENEWAAAWSRYREGKNPFAQASIVAPPKVGRNELCPCGSGKKYKKCCGGVGSAG